MQRAKKDDFLCLSLCIHKVPIMTAADDTFYDFFLNFKGIQGLRFDVNYLLAVDSHEISKLT